MYFQILVDLDLDLDFSSFRSRAHYQSFDDFDDLGRRLGRDASALCHNEFCLEPMDRVLRVVNLQQETNKRKARIFDLRIIDRSRDNAGGFCIAHMHAADGSRPSQFPHDLRLHCGAESISNSHMYN